MKDFSCYFCQKQLKLNNTYYVFCSCLYPIKYEFDIHHHLYSMAWYDQNYYNIYLYKHKHLNICRNTLHNLPYNLPFQIYLLSRQPHPPT